MVRCPLPVLLSAVTLLTFWPTLGRATLEDQAACACLTDFEVAAAGIEDVAVWTELTKRSTTHDDWKLYLKRYDPDAHELLEAEEELKVSSGWWVLDVPARIRRARVHFRQGKRAAFLAEVRDLDEVLAGVRQRLDQEPAHAKYDLEELVSDLALLMLDAGLVERAKELAADLEHSKPDLLVALGKLDAAERILKRRLDAIGADYEREDIESKNGRRFELRVRLAAIRWTRGDLEGALELLKELPPEEFPITLDHRVSAMSASTRLLLELGRQRDAERQARRLVSLVESAYAEYERKQRVELRPEHYVEALDALSSVLWSRGDFAGAERRLRKAMRILERKEAPPWPARKCSDEAVKAALAFHSRDKKLRCERAVPRAIPRKVILLGAERAEIAGIRAFDIVAGLRGQRIPPRVVILNNLGELRRSQGDVSGALRLTEQALDAFEKSHVQHSAPWWRSVLLLNLGELEAVAGDYSKAETHLTEARKISAEAFGAEHPDVALVEYWYAVVLTRAEKPKRALEMLEHALEVQESKLGADHPHVAMALEARARARLGLDDAEAAIADMKRAAKIRERYLSQVLPYGSERQKLAYLATLRPSTSDVLGLLLRAGAPDSDLKRFVFDVVLQRKGRVLDLLAAGAGSLGEGSTDAERQLMAQLRDARRELSRLAVETSLRSGEGVASLREKLQQQAEEAERKLLTVRADRGETLAERVTLSSVRAALPPSSVLLEIVRYEPERGENARYLAFVIRAEGQIEHGDLGPAARIDDLATRFRKALGSRSADSKELARQLDTLLFEPVVPLLAAAGRVIIAPDGPLSLIPFAALRRPDGKHRVFERELTYVTTARDLLRFGKRRASRSPDLVIANPSYGQRSKGAIYFPSLPGTAREGKTLQRLLPGARLLTGKAATERALTEARGPRILHAATHGFFLGEPQRAADGLRGLELTSSPTVESPLLRSGIALTNANEKAKAASDDGILTALEASSLDLKGTQLVVLSACETSVGEVRTGEGIFGLRRALTIAGAESQLGSLWKVDDEATSELMTRFYGHLMSGRGRSAALHLAQRELAAKSDTEHPNYWASFMLIGAPSRLDGAPDISVPAPSGKSKQLEMPKQAGGCACRAAGSRRYAPGWAVAWACLFGLGWRRRCHSALIRRS